MNVNLTLSEDEVAMLRDLLVRDIERIDDNVIDVESAYVNDWLAERATLAAILAKISTRGRPSTD